jgi:hypothetical protein
MNILRILVLLVAGIGSAFAQGSTRLVTNIADSGAGSLRAAVVGAPAGTLITFDPALNGQTITLTSTPIAIPPGLTIRGNGVANTRVSGANARRLFEIAPGAGGEVVIRDLTLAQGNAGNPGSGGAILNQASLRLEGVRLTGNRAGIAGGAILSQRVGAAPAPVLTVRGSTFDGNQIDAADCGSGAAIRSEGIGASVLVVNSTLAGNTAAGACSGGAIAIGAGSLEVIASTIGPNSGGRSGGNLYKGSRAATITLRNTVVVEGAAALNPDLHGAAAGLASLGLNLVGNRGDAAGFVANDLPADTPAMLGAIAPSAASPLPVRIPMAGSPLVDAVAVAACVDAGGGALASDQRGVPRPQAAACDIGAVERSFAFDDLLFANGFE